MAGRDFVIVNKSGPGAAQFRAWGGKLYEPQSGKAELAPTAVIHSLRHSFCSMLARRGVPMIEAQKLMGHGDIRLTARIYAQVDKEDLRGAVETLPELGGKEVWESKVAYQVDRLIEGVRRAS